MNVLKQKGTVSFIKMGKKVNSSKVQDIIESNGGIIFRGSQKRNNGKYYYAHLVSVNQYNKKLNCPKYYDNICKFEKNEAECFTVDSITEIKENEVDNFITISNENL